MMSMNAGMLLYSLTRNKTKNSRKLQKYIMHKEVVFLVPTTTYIRTILHIEIVRILSFKCASTWRLYPTQRSWFVRLNMRHDAHTTPVNPSQSPITRLLRPQCAASALASGRYQITRQLGRLFRRLIDAAGHHENGMSAAAGPR